MNTYLKYQSPTLQFLAFLTLAGGSIFLAVMISKYFFSDINTVLQSKDAVISAETIGRFKFAQLISAIVSFIVPALLFGYFSSPKALRYVGIQKTVSPVLLLLCIALLVLVQPFVSYLGELNSKVNFGSMQKQLQEAEAVYTRTIETFLKMKSVGDLMINLFIMALLPAIGEELFFRGSLQRVLLRLSDKPWLAIVVTSVIFALLHGTFFKIIPIFTLGLLLGSIYHFTRNLWYTITIHFFNNALAVLAFYFANRSDTIRKFANDNFTVPMYSAILSLTIVIAVMYFVKKKSDELLPAIITDEDNDYLV